MILLWLSNESGALVNANSGSSTVCGLQFGRTGARGSLIGYRVGRKLLRPTH